ncbi:hypothetical protein CPU2_583 [Blattabacterium punctulatus CPU2]|uniref:DUF192 domain-containing protein n=1 Tax=Blattabacterium punctulatus CPU2 TaxID=1457032 RepID=A0AAD1FRJ6_9FLAO|nr:DUF192 domain-containing protein [Blattabacterium punctulatus]AWU39070.1 DUF192 domain-containing protein [Blattabacterium punctulatus]BBA18055.1 hypothetical protein CPU2_583 [Blattabacterium punctulatus CPU2]
MKKIKILFLFFLFFLFSASEKSENEESLFFDVGDQLEIEFLKHGELYMKNKNFLIKKIDVELANTPIKIKNGLMYRSSLKENRGMLFLLTNKEDIYQINMKNMRIPLDIIYIDYFNTVFFINKYVYPMNRIEKINISNIKYILEINAGMSDKWGIKQGKTKIFFNK